eukprot:TRINITY_DN55868_c0_g1_i1.p1 TRINITY_DN55868_c0_g1~~TRINITY_DN55868_c0_g1_i1.p1  ORF type:complete len:246 (-),score=34.41 TRINITY_DN55868_c0_g1_i1:319-1056(-)
MAARMRRNGGSFGIVLFLFLFLGVLGAWLSPLAAIHRLFVREAFTSSGSGEPGKPGMTGETHGSNTGQDNLFGGTLLKGHDPFKEFVVNAAVGSRSLFGIGVHELGQYSSRSFSMSSTTDQGGTKHTETYAESAVGNREKGIHEARQAYSNSWSGVDKHAIERHVGRRGRKIVRERDRRTAEERATELHKGMEESEREMFEKEFAANSHYLPEFALGHESGLPSQEPDVGPNSSYISEQEAAKDL